METHEYERPWQVMPAKIIKLALEHAERDNDFDHQVAYLLLDIGVEAALKTYLLNRGQNVEKIYFPDLIKKVKEELPKTNPDLIHQINDIVYFHGIRNKLYHHGDGVKPTEDNLKRYSDIAERVVEEIIEVNLKTEEKKYVLEIREGRQEFEELIDAVESRFKYFLGSCGIVTEKARPAYGTREFAMKLRYILNQAADFEEDDPEDRIENRKYRIEKFNELTGNKLESHGFVDYVLEDINRLYVRIAFQQLGESWGDDWKEYVKLEERRSRLLSAWKHGIQSGSLTNGQIREEFEKIISWLENQQKKLDEWINSHMESISTRIRPMDFLDWDFF